jgi:hypothetical protein
MAQFRRSKTPTRWYAQVPRAAFERERTRPEDFPRFCGAVGEAVDVSLSRAGRDAVERMAPGEQDRYIVRALHFAQANETDRRRGGPYRVWATDFALLEGMRTEEEIEGWLKANALSTDSRDCGTLNVPPDAPQW